MRPRASAFEDRCHPRTRSLLPAVPIADPRRKRIRDAPTFKPVPLPVRPVDNVAEPSTDDEVAPGISK